MLNLNKSQPMYACKRYGYENNVPAFLANANYMKLHYSHVNYIVSLLCH